MNREFALKLDLVDGLAAVRDRFRLPEGLIYFDGNSLGALPIGVAERVAEVITQQWGHDLISSWNVNGWMAAPRRVGDKIAPIIGARAGEVIVGDSTSVNLYKLLSAAVAMRPGRNVIVTEPNNFPSDSYVIASVAKQHGMEVRPLDLNDPATVIGPDVAVVCLTHISYRTGAMYDLADVTERAHASGALMLWDLAHSAGAVPLALTDNDVDLAIGCGYKFLNGGPGAPSFAYVAARLQDDVHHPITGWLGHAAPFDMDDHFVPAPGIDRVTVGTPSILSLLALEAALDAFDGVAMEDVRSKALALSDFMIELVMGRESQRQGAQFGLSLATPVDPARRGSQVSFVHEHGYPIVRALAAAGVLGDYREPGIIRFGIAPLYTRFVDVYDAADRLTEILQDERWREPQFAIRAAVT
jgi:kynureninase